jgi:hypothetical protein
MEMFHFFPWSSTLPGSAAARASPAAVSFALRLRLFMFRLIVMDTHEAERVRAVRAPIVVRPEPYAREEIIARIRWLNELLEQLPKPSTKKTCH